MKLPSKKLITTGLLLIPLFLLAVYTFNGGRMQSKNKRISVSKLKLSTPTDTINEIASYIEEGDMETALTKINELLKDPNIPNSKGLPLLVLAAEKNDTELVATLLQLGANPNFAAVGSGESALMKAAANDNFAMVQVLVNANS
ncbi:MAG: ankyrin repeat domain-containing protein, partial [Elusimicrobiota bacterium]|nr:ankyrin repeat domain-containing protein [Elusimicrobiota bacterium]